jgi:hypothetical protein
VLEGRGEYELALAVLRMRYDATLLRKNVEHKERTGIKIRSDLPRDVGFAIVRRAYLYGDIGCAQRFLSFRFTELIPALVTKESHVGDEIRLAIRMIVEAKAPLAPRGTASLADTSQDLP